MKSPTVSVMVVTYAYGGNGGISSIIPELAQWATRTVIKMKSDPRIDRVEPVIISDTPITLGRNRAVKMAREKGHDFILMLDSDNEPDGYLGIDPEAKPFWDEAFTFAYDRLVKGIPTCIAAPYCGPPPHPVEKPGIIDGGEVPYLFQWSNKESHDPHAPHKLDILTRAEAAKLRGIYPVAALPTGCCLFTTSCFDGPPKPYFKYEWMDEDQSEKASTEDVYATRNISLYWSIGRGIDVCFATCDSWALHYKPKRVGKPYVIPVEAVARNMREALETNFSIREHKVSLDLEIPATGLLRGPESKPEPEPQVDVSTLKRRWEKLGPDDNMVYISDEEWQGLAELDRGQSVPAEAVQEPAPVAVEEPKPHTQNGHGLRHKMIGQRKVAVLDRELGDLEVQNIQAITNWLVGKLEGGIDVAVIHPGTGQGTAAILSCLPQMSRLLAFDSTGQYGSQEPAKHFLRTYDKELESGLVKADIEGSKFPNVKNYRVDMAFIEDFVTAGKLEAWLKAVSPRGLLCGLGHNDPTVEAIVEKFRDKHGLPLREAGDLWVLPVGGIANA